MFPHRQAQRGLQRSGHEVVTRVLRSPNIADSCCPLPYSAHITHTSLAACATAPARLLAAGSLPSWGPRPEPPRAAIGDRRVVDDPTEQHRCAQELWVVLCERRPTASCCCPLGRPPELLLPDRGVRSTRRRAVEHSGAFGTGALAAALLPPPAAATLTVPNPICPPP